MAWFLLGAVLVVMATLPLWIDAVLLPRIPVQALPPGYHPQTPAEPYSGTLPAQLTRPIDPVHYPIHLGEIGPTESLFSGPKQYPFACDTLRSGLGQPEIDNHDGIGTPVYQNVWLRYRVVGYSADCLARTQAWYYYKPRGRDSFKLWSPTVNDADTAHVNGVSVPFIVRVEMGTINRFVYAIAALKGTHESLAEPAADHWNHRLIYQFKGGVGVGFRQGNLQPKKILFDRMHELALGYAFVSSSGNATSNHYNIWLQEDIALRLKHQFTALYGSPLYTVGVGGSGGGLQQYLLAQNRPGLLDGAIAQVAFPDMATQIIPVFDCELLEYYFDVTMAGDPFWQNAAHRRDIEGFNANDKMPFNYKFLGYLAVAGLASLSNGQWPHHWVPTECAVSWRGLTPLVLNPRYVHFRDRFVESVAEQVHFTHFDDVKLVYGVDLSGNARIPWDNVGVQYGLTALKHGSITPEQFLHLNFHVGSWKKQEDMRNERYWRIVGHGDLQSFSPWSEHNQRLADNAKPAPRYHGDEQAMSAATRAGMVFNGNIDIPVIDVRYYLEPQLNMHHAAASFSARMRITRARGDANNQVIWVSDPEFDPTQLAFAAMDRWLQDRRQSSGLNALPPDYVSDRCFDGRGQVMASGEHVWDGEWNQQPSGACMQRFPVYSTSRVMAGASLAGDVFKCVLQPVETALARGIYEPIDMSPYQKNLKTIFPEGVCDYDQKVGVPETAM